MSLIAGNLAVVQKLLDSSTMQWGVFGGAAAHFYGNRRPINDIDIVVQKGQLGRVASLLQQSHKAVQFDGGRILWRGIKIFEDLTIQRDGRTYPLQVDEAMVAHLVRKPLLGARVLMLCPEDVVAHKLLIYRDRDEGKYDIEDIKSVMNKQKLDRTYLKERIVRMGAEQLIAPRLKEVGLDLEAHPEGNPAS